ncbi:xylulokinase [Acuticoccus sp. MNP-M23]|uniref:xylulokinase n=1 Tax=Acuticoccus sp. MNP-M23 TaxID=3072793 RepID=UPI0028155FD8|nr:xylulokinase [Acuticoccus sp. MNP-M23]WMS40892.1 xylulokinase [Acuticoccus sp. MNP-M23]
MFLGIDLGTSSVKALLIDEAQAIVAEATAPLTVSRPHPGWSEQAPADWIEATRAALTALGAKTPLDGVKGIGLSGQMHGATLLDKAHDVLRPSILWNDTRAGAEAADLSSIPGYAQKAGSLIFAGFTAPKLVWVARNEPDLFKQTALVLLPKDYLRLWLTGEAVSEMSDASGTAWLDVGARNWSPELLSESELSTDNMPRLVEGSATSGTLRAEVASEFGLPAGIPIAGGGGDNAAAAIGMGVTQPSTAFVSLGTSGVVFAPAANFSPMPSSATHTFCHALPDLWHHMGVILAATDALNWYASLTGADPATLTEGLGPLQPPGRAMFLPYLGGERTPHNAPDARASFIGLGHEVDRAAGARAVMEGVAFALRDCAEALSACGTHLDEVIAVGGGSRSRYWLELIATVLGVPVNVPADGDFGAAFGAARLGALAAGADVSIVTPPAIQETIAPSNALSGAFADAHHRYKATYNALEDLS